VFVHGIFLTDDPNLLNQSRPTDTQCPFRSCYPSVEN
jgi:hypothetical protein